ncbi:AAA family ATPase [Jiella sp. M17.18]|uniref:AAA family ATPase n=1 Tax=Jiella sp. M17.18 TaxID=3234247 RepID=UPI0034DE5F98
MYCLALEDFRGFHQQGFVSIRPITILIGENSAGKSSFLSAIKYMMDFVSGNSEASFNKDPFQLGTFQQIAHYRGGKAGRAKSFFITLKTNVDRSRRQPHVEPDISVEFRIAFESSESQPVISAIHISTKAGSLSASIDNRRFRVEITLKDGGTYPIEEGNDFPRFARNDFTRYWPFLLRDLRYRLSRRNRGSEGQLFPNAPDLDVSHFIEVADALSEKLSGPIEATSAIRTKPLRTYTPGAEAPDGEGSHVPFEIAKLFRATNKDPWRRLKSNLEDFGTASGMFREISVKSFGRSASDPFQIQLSSDGPKTNLVDLGYGTSQVIPIIYNISSQSPRSTHLIQQPEVHLHARAQAALGQYFVESYLGNGSEFVLETHSDFIVDRVRQAVFQRRISPDDVSILFFERGRLENHITEVSLDTNGEPVDAPSSYRSFFVDEQLRTLGVEPIDTNH